MAYTYEYPRPALTVDCVVFGLDERGSQGAADPARARAVPGTVGAARRLRAASTRRSTTPRAASCRRRRASRTSTSSSSTPSATPDRDPRERVVTVAYYALVKLVGPPHPRRDRRDATPRWFASRTTAEARRSITPTSSRTALRAAAGQGPLRSRSASSCCRREVHAVAAPAALRDHPRHRSTSATSARRSSRMDLLVETDEVEQDVAHRAARLYRFDDEKYKRLRRRGFNFESVNGADSGIEDEQGISPRPSTSCSSGAGGRRSGRRRVSAWTASRYNCCEQFMMAEKAAYLATRTPSEGFSLPSRRATRRRSAVRFMISTSAVWNARLPRDRLRAATSPGSARTRSLRPAAGYGRRTIVEASPTDRTWGIGLGDRIIHGAQRPDSGAVRLARHRSDAGYVPNAPAERHPVRWSLRLTPNCWPNCHGTGNCASRTPFVRSHGEPAHELHRSPHRIRRRRCEHLPRRRDHRLRRLAAGDGGPARRVGPGRPQPAARATSRSTTPRPRGSRSGGNSGTSGGQRPAVLVPPATLCPIALYELVHGRCGRTRCSSASIRRTPGEPTSRFKRSSFGPRFGSSIRCLSWRSRCWRGTTRRV